MSKDLFFIPFSRVRKVKHNNSFKDFYMCKSLISHFILKNDRVKSLHFLGMFVNKPFYSEHIKMH